MYEKGPFDTIVEGESLTEQEHKDSCDINIMIKNALRGAQIRGSEIADYGYDDTTMDGVQFRIQKANLEKQLATGEKEFTKETLALIPESIVKRFGFTVKETPKKDDQTTIKGDTLNENPPSATTPQEIQKS